MKFVTHKGLIQPELILGTTNPPKNRRKIHVGYLAAGMMLAPFCVLDVLGATFGPEGTKLGFAIVGIPTSIATILLSLKSLRAL